MLERGGVKPKQMFYIVRHSATAYEEHEALPSRLYSHSRNESSLLSVHFYYPIAVVYKKYRESEREIETLGNKPTTATQTFEMDGQVLSTQSTHNFLCVCRNVHFVEAIRHLISNEDETLNRIILIGPQKK